MSKRKGWSRKRGRVQRGTGAARAEVLAVQEFQERTQNQEGGEEGQEEQQEGSECAGNNAAALVGK